MKFRSIIAALAALAALAAAGCSSTTSGSGRVGSPQAGSSSPDFPSGSVGGSEPASGGASSAAGSTAPTRVRHGVPSAPIRTVTVHAADRRTYVVEIWADVTDDTCFDHAHGDPVVTFLTKHPCTGLRRYLGTTTVGGRRVGFALSSTGFDGPPSNPYEWAGQFTKLEEQDGTGSIDDLLSDGYRLPEGPTSIPADEAFNVVGQDEGVTVWDAWYLDGPTPDNAKALIKMTQDLFLQF